MVTNMNVSGKLVRRAAVLEGLIYRKAGWKALRD
jgi:hypothetical protein